MARPQQRPRVEPATKAARHARIVDVLTEHDVRSQAELATLLDEGRLEVLARQHGIRRTKDAEAIDELFTVFVRRADEGTLGRLLVEATVLLKAARGNAAQVLRDAAATYKLDTDAITIKVKQEFAAKEKAKTFLDAEQPL